ncbi:MAG: transcriptional repressor, CopY family [Firmicutes bacterium]|nr:transcriptional repressor, CopY family [Bacillota bacterium]
MNENTTKISHAELEIMKILWQADEPVSTNDIYKELSEKMSWDRSTVRTLLKRLSEKDAVTVKNLKVISYLPLIQEKEYRDSQTKSFIERLYGGSAKRLVSSLVENYNLTPADIDELRSLLEQGGDKIE